jgi:hypothetical protein
VVMSFFWGGENQQHVFGGAREDDGKEHAIHISSLSSDSCVSFV